MCSKRNFKKRFGKKNLSLKAGEGNVQLTWASPHTIGPLLLTQVCRLDLEIGGKNLLKKKQVLHFDNITVFKFMNSETA